MDLRSILICLFFMSAVSACRQDLSSDVEVATFIDGADYTVIVTETDSGRWEIDFLFDSPQNALIFSRSTGDYRTDTWFPEEGAPPVERIGGFDTLIFETPMNSVSYEIEPRSEGIPRDYTPFLTFSDGGVAVYTGQFELLPVADRAGVEALEGDLGRWQGEQPQVGVRVQSERPKLYNGQSIEGAVEHVSLGAGTYVYVGEGQLEEGDSFVGVIDTALPEHIRESFDKDLSAIFAEFEARWGFELPEKGTIYFAFEGYDREGYSNKGSVVGRSLMVLQSSGEALREPNDEVRVRNLWFFAHEGAHMFQNVVMDRFSVGPHAWIHEGGANAMANSAIQALDGVPADFILSEYRNAFETCSTDLGRGSLETAHVDGRFYAHYWCGQLFSAATDAALPDHDLYSFWLQFSADLQDEEADVGEAYLEKLEELSGNTDISERIRRLAYEDIDDPRGELSDLLIASGLNPVFDGDGALISLALPE